MKKRTFELLDYINRWSLDSSIWGLYSHVDSTVDMFGVVEDIEIETPFLYLYCEDSDLVDDLRFLGLTPDYDLSFTDSDTRLYIYYI